MNQRRPTRRMLHGVIILVTFFNFSLNIIKITEQVFPHNFSPWKGPLTDAGDGNGGGNKSQQLTRKNIVFYICSPEGNRD